jgi:hypothetical protein
VDQVRNLKDDAFDEILWFRIPKLEKVSEEVWIRSKITTVLQVVKMPRRVMLQPHRQSVVAIWESRLQENKSNSGCIKRDR